MNLFKFIDEVKQEMRLVTWATQKETIYTTFFVMIVVAVFAVYFLCADYCIYSAVRALLIK